MPWYDTELHYLHSTCQHFRVTTPLITVITPAFNIEPYVAEAVESVLAQTEADFEYLIVDDGSTDKTLEIVNGLAARDSRIRVIPLEGSGNGSSAARNRALREARGTYIAFLDGDDIWTPNFLADSRKVLETAPAEVGATFCASRYVDELARYWGWTQTSAPGDYDANRMLAGHCPPANGSSLFLRKSVFDEAGLFDEALFNCVDLDMWLRINTKSSTPLFRYIGEPMANWRVRPGAISRNESKRVAGLDEMFKRYGQYLKRESIADAYIWPATLAFYAGDDDIAKRWSDEVRKADPKFFLRSKHGAVLGTFLLVGPKNGRHLRSAARSALKAQRNVRLNLAQRISKQSRQGS
jgi:glycosyltransferase involved in cell wall biosynthesis